MKMKQISDSTIKITIQLEDLEERGMEIADFLVPQEKTEEFFYAILDELEMPESFLDSGMLSFRVTPKPDKLDVFVANQKIDQQLDFEDLSDLPDMEELSRMTPDEFIKTLEKQSLIRQKGIRSYSPFGTRRSYVTIKEQDPTSEAPVSQYIYYIFAFFKYQQAVAFSKMVSFQWIPLNYTKWDRLLFNQILIDTEDQPTQYPDLVTGHHSGVCR